MALSLSFVVELARRGLSGIVASWSPDFPRASFLRELRDARVRPTACGGRIAGGEELVKGLVKKLTGAKHRARTTDGRFYIDGRTQDERAVGEVSFAHGGCGGTKFPRKRPRVSGARKRFLRPSCDSFLSLGRGTTESSYHSYESACALLRNALLNKRLRASRVDFCPVCCASAGEINSPARR